jgi:cephalosporin-C deacetylase-like acetyl esterase
MAWCATFKGGKMAMPAQDDLAAQLRSLDSNVFSPDERTSLAQMLRNDVRARRNAANQRDAEAWAQVRSKADWERFVAPRIKALRKSLGIFPPAPRNLNVQVTRTMDGDGYRIENVVYESRPSVFVTANLYLPASRHSERSDKSHGEMLHGVYPERVEILRSAQNDTKRRVQHDKRGRREKIPAIVIIHSHHNPKTQGELQDMGMTWARAGCAVLVMDQLSYSERRQHPPGNRQDYRFRTINGIQLHLIGDSLMGWMVWDVMRGVDVLMQHKEIDRNRIILIGSVAGGGDPAAVTAALDSRIACVIPFNFGGPQPETPYPLSGDAEQTFNYMGSGSWESTRNLRLSGRDGFLPWVIVASVAPRCLIHAHEFSWDRERDPVWKRYQKTFAFYGASDNLSFAHGAGVLSGRPPEATHCNNIGAVHRAMIYPALQRWFDVPIPQEYSQRRPPEELMCLTPAHKPRPLHELYAEIGASRAAAFRGQLGKLPRDEQRQWLRQAWAKLLGDVEPNDSIAVQRHQINRLRPGIHFESFALEVEPHIVVPTLLLLPYKVGVKPPVVVAVSQHGKAKFLSERAEGIAELLKNGVAVCLPDVRGTGETAPEGSRQYNSEATSISATEWMMGQTLLGSRLRDLRAVLDYLRRCGDVDAKRIALWGDSFAPTNPPGFADPLIGEDEPPRSSEPSGGLLALFGALYEDDVCAVVARGMLAGYQSALRDRFCYVPHDAIVPGALTAGDLGDVAAALAPRPLRLENLVDGRNVLLSAAEARQRFEPTVKAYRRAPDRLLLMPETAEGVAVWLVKAFNAKAKRHNLKEVKQSCERWL